MADSTYEKMLNKVQALLAKAESTPYPEESDALFAKAQELMTRYCIDEALARGDRLSKRGAPTLRSFTIEEPYRTAKRTLLSAVAGANDVRVVIGQGGSITLAGFASDIEVTELLFASLLVHATREMHASASRDAPTRVRAYRHAFFVAYGTRIANRLHSARRAATVEAESSTGMSLVPLFAQRQSSVDAFLKERFPTLRSARRTSVSDARGVDAGFAAANRADLGQQGISKRAS
ncbi:MAG TPA: DUF2786 domain-containing protein [Acidimicrobiales bacterium]|nr:DUF2786 domain-containing protein [Acidimicrobiales bacterium]